MSSLSNPTVLAHEQAGQGAPVLLLHGFPLCRAMWQPQIGPLTEAGYRLIIPDLRGYGETPPGDDRITMDLYADDVVRLLDHLDIDRAVVGGMSMGGYILLNLLHRHPDRVSHPLFLVTRAAGDDEAGKARRSDLIKAVSEGRPEKVADMFESILFSPMTALNQPDLVAGVRQWMISTDPAGLIGGLQAMRDRQDYVDLLPKFKSRTLVVGAENDLAVPLEHSRLLHRELPDSRFCIVRNAGHMANMERPDQFNRCLIDFLNKIFLRPEG